MINFRIQVPNHHIRSLRRLAMQISNNKEEHRNAEKEVFDIKFTQENRHHFPKRWARGTGTRT